MPPRRSGSTSRGGIRVRSKKAISWMRSWPNHRRLPPILRWNHRQIHPIGRTCGRTKPRRPRRSPRPRSRRMRTSTRRYQVMTLIGCGIITTARPLPSRTLTIPLLLRDRTLTAVTHALRSVAGPPLSPLYRPRSFSPRMMDHPIRLCGWMLNPLNMRKAAPISESHRFHPPRLPPLPVRAAEAAGKVAGGEIHGRAQAAGPTVEATVVTPKKRPTEDD